MTISKADVAPLFKESARGVSFSVTVLPRSSKCELTGFQEGALKVKLTKPPVDGEANAECCRFFSSILHIPKSQITVLRGASSRHKLLAVTGITAEGACERIISELQPDSARSAGARGDRSC